MKTPACFRLFVATLALVLAPLSALAVGPGTPVTYTDEATFLSQIVAGTAENGDFNDLAGGSPFVGTPLNRTVAPYTYTATTTDLSFQLWGNLSTPPLDAWLSTLSDGAIIDFASLDRAGDVVEAFGFHAFGLNGGTNQFDNSLELTVTMNSGLATEQSITATPSSIANSFFGFILGQEQGGITSVRVALSAATPATNKVAVQNVTFAVPEPSTYALLAMAATTGGLCQLRRRRNSKKAQG